MLRKSPNHLIVCIECAEYNTPKREETPSCHQQSSNSLLLASSDWPRPSGSHRSRLSARYRSDGYRLARQGNPISGSQAPTWTQPSNAQTSFPMRSLEVSLNTAKSTTDLEILPAGSLTRSSHQAKKPWPGKPTIATETTKTMPGPTSLCTAIPNLGNRSTLAVGPPRQTSRANPSVSKFRPR